MIIGDVMVGNQQNKRRKISRDEGKGFVKKTDNKNRFEGGDFLQPEALNDFLESHFPGVKLDEANPLYDFVAELQPFVRKNVSGAKVAHVESA